MNEHLESKLLDYRWNELWGIVKHSDTPEHEAYRCILMAAWWQEFGMAITLRRNAWRTSTTDLELFAYSYVSLCVGDRPGYLRALDGLQRKKSSDRYIKWLELEWLGRSRQFEAQARLFRKIITKYEEEIWPFAACLQSLNQVNIDARFLLKVLDDLPENSRNKSDRFALKYLLLRKSNNQNNNFLSDEIEYSASYYFHKGWYLSTQEQSIRAVPIWDYSAKLSWIDYGMLNDWLALSISNSSTEKDTENRVLHSLSIIPNNPESEAAIATIALIRYWIEQKDNHAFNLISKYEFFKDISIETSRNLRIFFLYILLLFVHRQQNISVYRASQNEISENLYVLGESHSLSPSNLQFRLQGKLLFAVSKFVMGIKIWHLTSKAISLQKSSMLARLESFEHNSNVLICIGEIDSRPDQGIWMNYKKKGNSKSLIEIIGETLMGYKNLLEKYKSRLNIVIQNVPAPTEIAAKRLPPEDLKDYLQMFEILNREIKKMAAESNIKCIDVYAATKGVNGFSNLEWHLDAYHLKPIFYLSAEKWLV